MQTVLGRKRWLSALQYPDFDCAVPEVLATLNRLRNENTIQKLIADAAKEGITIVDRRSRKVMETRQVVNSIIQGSAADMTKLAIVQACKDERLKQLGCKILLQIHDELIIECPPDTKLEDICEKMGSTPPWVKGLCLRADGFVSDHYKKD